MTLWLTWWSLLRRRRDHGDVYLIVNPGHQPHHELFKCAPNHFDALPARDGRHDAPQMVLCIAHSPFHWERAASTHGVWSVSGRMPCELQAVRDLVLLPNVLLSVVYFGLGTLLYRLEARQPWCDWYRRLRSETLPPLNQQPSSRRKSDSEINTTDSAADPTAEETGFVPSVDEVVMTVATNFVGSTLLFGTLVYWTARSRATLCDDLSSKWTVTESIWMALGKMLISAAVGDTWFYHVHRLAHASPWLYRHVHSLHHEARRPYALVTSYSTFVDSLVISFPTVFLGSIVTRMSLPVSCLWIVLATVYTMLEHSGFKALPLGILDPPHHHLHHMYKRANFGLTRLWDWLYGTLLVR